MTPLHRQCYRFPCFLKVTLSGAGLALLLLDGATSKFTVPSGQRQVLVNGGGALAVPLPGIVAPGSCTEMQRVRSVQRPLPISQTTRLLVPWTARNHWLIE